MAVSGIEINITYTVDGVSADFAYPYYFRDPSDLIVTITDVNGNVTSLVYNSDYIVSATAANGVYPNGGTVVLTTPSKWAAGGTMLITRRTPKQQDTSYTNSSAFPAKTNETALDLIVLQVQEIARHFQGYADGFPSEGSYHTDDWFLIRNAASFGFAAIWCVAGDGSGPGTWRGAIPISGI